MKRITSRQEKSPTKSRREDSGNNHHLVVVNGLDEVLPPAGCLVTQRLKTNQNICQADNTHICRQYVIREAMTPEWGKTFHGVFLNMTIRQMNCSENRVGMQMC